MRTACEIGCVRIGREEEGVTRAQYSIEDHSPFDLEYVLYPTLNPDLTQTLTPPTHTRFRVGQSSLIWLLYGRPDLRVIAFDEWLYENTYLGAIKLHEWFGPNGAILELHGGSTLDSIPTYAQWHPEVRVRGLGFGVWVRNRKGGSSHVRGMEGRAEAFLSLRQLACDLIFVNDRHHEEQVRRSVSVESPESSVMRLINRSA